MDMEASDETDGDVTIDNPVREQRHRAAHALVQALQASGARSLPPKIGTSLTPAITLALLQDSMPAILIGDGLPTPAAAAAVQQGLREQGVQAQVEVQDIMGFPALQIALATVDDTQRLADLVMSRLPEPHAASHRLRTTLATAGVKAINMRVQGGVIEVGGISATDACTLLVILGGHLPDRIELEDWHHLEALAEMLSAALHTASGRVIDVVADPACSTCSATRTYEITLGPVAPEQARRLADAVESAVTPTSPEQQPVRCR
ncbi:hypothetical protein AR457_40300 [Streptomyces agglomeratus]|uniref:hypothetical protein n=1 Tax=Streptomyces agglomeratus TaxID=285458 RepID=UPI0008524DDE|nr:hypothetical protein [Streptomyces agglomeratus]OEJ22127.1 hypothetical protein AR457_40300 [Streptomyces agglomeratus]OEJ36965.1 hypothetical protein BGK70_00955 [Streptomyces agglomeratus]